MGDCVRCGRWKKEKNKVVFASQVASMQSMTSSKSTPTFKYIIFKCIFTERTFIKTQQDPDGTLKNFSSIFGERAALAAVNKELRGVIDERFGWQQQAAVFTQDKLPLSLPPVHAPPSQSLWRDAVHMAGSLVSGWLQIPWGGISLPDWQLNKQKKNWYSCLPTLPSNR